MRYTSGAEIVRIEVLGDKTGNRLDSFLAEELEMARNAVQRLIEDGAVTLSGETLKKKL